MFNLFNADTESTTSKEYILSRVSELDILRHYFGNNITFSRNIKSPFRNESNPSFRFSVYSDGRIRWKDFGSGDHGDIFSLIQILYNCGFRTALDNIVRDMGLKKYCDNKIKKSYEARMLLGIEHLPTKRKKKDIEIRKQLFTKTDIIYWGCYGIPIETLERYCVHSCSSVLLNGVECCRYTKDDPIYAYEFTNESDVSYKIYRPLNANGYKFIYNGLDYYMQGYNQLPEGGKLLILTKSLKDCMVLYELGYNSVSLQSESVKLRYDNYQELRRRFKNIIVFYDNDDAGIKYSQNICSEYNMKSIVIPVNDDGVKDISDAYHILGVDYCNKLIKELLCEKICYDNVY